MTSEQQSPLQPLLRKLQQWRELDLMDQEAVLGLPFRLELLERGQYIVREDDKPSHSCLIVSGFAYRHKIVADGGRSINAIHMRGDMVDLQNSLLRLADHNVQALTQCKVAFIPRDSLIELAFAHPAVGMAMWYDTLVDGSIFREWIANIGRRNSAARIAHVLCEFAIRAETAGLGENCSGIIGREIAEDAVGQRLVETRGVERGKDVRDGCPVGHENPAAAKRGRLSI